MKHASVQITTGSISQARNIFPFRGIVRALSTGLWLYIGNGDFNSIYLRGIARTRVRRTCIYRDTGGGERVLVLKYPWPFCLSTPPPIYVHSHGTLWFAFARSSFLENYWEARSIRIHGIYACRNPRWCIRETRSGGVYVISLRDLVVGRIIYGIWWKYYVS